MKNTLSVRLWHGAYLSKTGTHFVHEVEETNVSYSVILVLCYSCSWVRLKLCCNCISKVTFVLLHRVSFVRVTFWKLATLALAYADVTGIIVNLAKELVKRLKIVFLVSFYRGPRLWRRQQNKELKRTNWNNWIKRIICQDKNFITLA